MQWVKFSEEAHDKQNKIRPVLVKVSILRNNKYNQSDPLLAWIMFHKIVHIYRDTVKQDNFQESQMIQGLHVNFDSTKTAGMPP